MTNYKGVFKQIDLEKIDQYDIEKDKESFNKGQHSFTWVGDISCPNRNTMRKDVSPDIK